MIVGRVKEIWRYPVKSMAGERLGSCTLGAAGIPGDRGWAIRDETAGEIRGAKKLPQLLLCAARYVEEPSDGRIPPAEITFPDGRRLRLGGATVSVELPTPRCVMVTLPQDDLPKDPAVLRTIVRDAAQNVGMYANVAEAGAIAVGDPVELA